MNTNDDKTRTFVGLEATSGVKDLQKLTTNVDYCFSEYKLPVFYYPLSLHPFMRALVGVWGHEISDQRKTSEIGAEVGGYSGG